MKHSNPNRSSKGKHKPARFQKRRTLLRTFKRDLKRKTKTVTKDVNGSVAVEYAILVSLLAPAAVAVAVVIDQYLTEQTAMMSAHTQAMSELRTVICASLTSPPPECP